MLICAGEVSGQTGSYAGTVVFSRMPVSGAAVWLHWDRGDGPKLIETRSDGQGKFRLQCPKAEEDNVVALIARAADGRIGWRLLGRRGLSDDHPDEAEFSVELLPVGEARGRLTDSSGKPVVRARINVNALQLSERDGSRALSLHDMPPQLALLFEAITKDDGTFALPGIPLGASVYATLATDDYKDLHLGWQQGQTGEFRLEQPGRVRIRFTGAKHVEKLAGLALSIVVTTPASLAPSAGKARVTSFVRYSREIESAGTDTVVVDNVLPGRAQIRSSGSEGALYFVADVARIVVKPGETTEVTLVVAPAAHVRGRVISQETGKGIAGAKIAIPSQDKNGKHLGYVVTTTGADGAFASYIRPGQIAAYLNNQIPAGYVAPASNRQRVDPVVVAGGAEHVFPDIVLEPALPLEGIVVDEHGKPIPGVRVHSAAWEPAFETVDPRTDEQGRFVLNTLAARDITALRVRTANAVTDGAVPVDRAQTKGPIKLVVSEKWACRLKGRVADGAGKPVGGAELTVIWHFSGVGRAANWGSSRAIETLRTDKDGRFQTTALWPGDRYEISVAADGFAKTQAVVLRGEAGKVHDLATVTLVRTNVTVAGVVVDSAGKPVAGVTVFNQGDAPRTLSTTTGADGRFQLTGLYDGPCYVFARKAGYRFAMTRLPAAASEAHITLQRDDEPTPVAAQPIRAPERIAAERKAVEYLIDKVLAMPEPATGGYKHFVFGYLVRIEPARARKWLAANQPNAGPDSPYARTLRRADIERLAGEDLDEALTLAEPLPPRDAIPLLFDLADHFAKSDLSRALRFTEEAVVRARAADPADQAGHLAHAGDLVIRLGRPAAGKKLLEEAVRIGEKLGTDERGGFYRARIAQHLAVHDLPRARKLVNGPTGEWANRYLSMLAISMARTDARTALALVDEMSRDRGSYRPLTQMAIARRVAERDPAEAVRILDSIDDADYKTRYQAEGLAHVAVVVAARDRKLAWSLIDRNLALYLDQPEAWRAWSNYGGRSVFAAWSAGQAQAIGYPDMASVVARVLACRPTEADAHSPAHRLETLVRMAKVLALIDPAAARDMLEVVAPRSDLLGTGYSGFDHQDWLLARCLADPERTAALVDEAIAALASRKGQLAFYNSGLMQLADVLTAPPAQRVTIIMGLNSGLALRAEDW
jgi:hypothetical protein